jgi:hypothetical protein
MSQIIAVKDNTPACGIVTYWSIQGSVHYDSTCQALTARSLVGADALPARMSPGKVLTTALEASHTTRGGMTKVMPVKGEPSGTIGLYRHTGSKNSSDYHCLWCVSADSEGKLHYKDMAEQRDIFDEEMLQDQFDRIWGTLDSSAVGSFLARIVRSPAINGLGLRAAGGVYFVPPETKQRWLDIVKCFPTVSIFQIPAMDGPDAVAAVIAALGEEAAKLAQDTMEIRRKALSTEKEPGKYGPRASTLEKAAAEAEAGINKIVMYEKLLGTNLELLRKQISDAMLEKQTADVLTL